MHHFFFEYGKVTLLQYKERSEFCITKAHLANSVKAILKMANSLARQL